MIKIPCTQDELHQVRLAAQLKGQTLQDYVIKAINAALIKDGVDAVLLIEDTAEDW